MKMKSLFTRARASRSRRGFVLIVVLVMLVITTAVVVGQLSTVRSQAIASVRVEEEAQARAIAEGCLALLQRYVNEYMNPANPVFADFDGLLNPSGAPNQPRINGATLNTIIPASGLPWAFLPRPSSPQNGACYLCLEDNSDDGLNNIATQPGATDSDEGPAAPNNGHDNRLKDRDRAIYLTVIGVYPAPSGMSGAEVWRNAHARVTLRRLYAVTNLPQPKPSICASNVSIGNNGNFCGTGGVQATGNVTIGGGSACICGSIAGNTVSAPTNQCGCCTSTSGSSIASGSAITCPAFPSPSPRNHLHVSGFGDPNNEAGINLGNTSVCKFFVMRSGDTFVWDVTDTNPQETLSAPQSASTSTAAKYGLTLINVSAANNQNCSNFTPGAGAEVPRPCFWNFDTDPPTVNCANDAVAPFGPRSLCWKPLARLNGGATADASFRNGNLGALDPLDPFISNKDEWESINKDSNLIFFRNVPIPYSRNRTKVFGDNANQFCGAPPSLCAGCCQNCPTTVDRHSSEWLFECNSPSDTACGDIHAHNRWSNRRFPAPAVFVFEHNATKFEIEQDTSDNRPVWATLLLDRDARIKSSTGFCSAHMPLPGAGPAGGRSGCSNPMNVRTIPTAQCRSGDPLVPPPPPPPMGPTPPAQKNVPPKLTYPIVYRVNPSSNIECNFDQSNITLVGTVDCPRIRVDAQQCFVGDMLATSTGSSGGEMADCVTAECPTASICMDVDFSSAYMNIWSNGSVCGGNSNNGTIVADLYVNGNVDMKNSITVTGFIQATGNVHFKNNARINYDGSANLVTTGNQSMTSYMECAW